MEDVHGFDPDFYFLKIARYFLKKFFTELEMCGVIFPS